MDKFKSTKSVLIGIGIVTLLATVISGLTRGSLTEQWWALLLGASLIVIAFSINEKPEGN